ncbi:MAG: isochorismate synthase [Candidatus Latescibacterota bacterium]|jgi:isochorismate synthase
MNTSEWLQRIDNFHTKKAPFACYMSPESDIVVSYFQTDNELHTASELKEEGFHIAPFLFNKTSYYLPREACEMMQTHLAVSNQIIDKVAFDSTPEEHKKYEALVSKAISQIETGSVDKIVVSMKKDVKLKQFSIVALVKQLFSSYPAAFKYIWFHPKTGLWCGATPEILLKTDAVSFSTMALAGTRVYDALKEPQWQEKELDEQQIVTDAITESLQKLITVFKISKTHNHKAGNLVHLRTDIGGILKKGNTGLNGIVSVLHPTPAICGRPKNLAAAFITEHEGYNREFYTGFVGPVAHKNTALYVNLRCLKIIDDQATLFVGGGITKASNPLAEWEETQNKLQTMLRVLYPML